MKKSLFILAASAFVLAGCNNDVTLDENVALAGSNAQKEIGFSTINTPIKHGPRRAPITGTTFPNTLDMKVTAYQVEATGGAAGVYFDATPFKYQYKGGADSDEGALWGGDPARYWPLTPAYINFLAIANANADNSTGVTWGTDKADQVTIVMSDNHEAQRDLVYARGNGAVTQPSGNALVFPTSINMQFLHAQAWIDFQVKANTTVEQAITINSITLTGAKYNGTYTVTHTNYDAKTSQSVAGEWDNLGDAQNVVVPGWSANTLSAANFTTVGNGLMIVPDDDAETADFTSFTIAYTYDNKNYTYTYAPASRNVDQAKHYIYKITFKLHEIYIEPTVENWDENPAPVETPITIND